MKNKRGWLRILEAFTGIMLLAGVIIIIASNSRANLHDSANQAYDAESGILMKIYTDNSLRNKILNSFYNPGTDQWENFPLPLNWEDFNEVNGLLDVKNKIISETPGYLDCKAKLCEIKDACAQDSASDKNIYVQSAIITSNVTDYRPRKLNLFCAQI